MMNRQKINDALKELYEFNAKQSGSIDCDELMLESNVYSLYQYSDYRDDEAAFTVYQLENKDTGEKAFIQYQGEWNSWDSNYYDDNEFDFVIVDKRPVTEIKWCDIEHERKPECQ